MDLLFTNGKSVEFGMKLTPLSEKEKRHMVELVKGKPVTADSMLMSSNSIAVLTNKTTNKIPAQKQNPAKQSINGKSNTPIRKPGN